MSNTSIQVPTIAREGVCCACGQPTHMTHHEQLSNVLSARAQLERAGWAPTQGMVRVLKKAGVPVLRLPIASADENYAPKHMVDVALAMAGSKVDAATRKGILVDALEGRLQRDAFIKSMRTVKGIKGRSHQPSAKTVRELAEAARG